MTLQLLKKLRALGVPLGGTDDLYSIRRTYAGHNMRSAGAWSWTLEYSGPEHNEGIQAMATGSQWPVNFLLKRKLAADRDKFGQWHIDPAGSIEEIESTDRQRSNF